MHQSLVDLCHNISLATSAIERKVSVTGPAGCLPVLNGHSATLAAGCLPPLRPHRRNPEGRRYATVRGKGRLEGCRSTTASASRCVRMDGPGAPRSASTSSNTARQYSGGNSSAGPTAGDVGGAFPRAAAAMACFSICFRVGMRQLAGRSVMSRLEHTKNKCRVR